MATASAALPDARTCGVLQLSEGPTDLHAAELSILHLTCVLEAHMHQSCIQRLSPCPHTAWQVVWGLSLMIAAPVLLSARLIPDSHIEALLGAAATGAVFAELFMIKV